MKTIQLATKKGKRWLSVAVSVVEKEAVITD
jgi:hypothetical protein